MQHVCIAQGKNIGRWGDWREHSVPDTNNDSIKQGKHMQMSAPRAYTDTQRVLMHRWSCVIVERSTACLRRENRDWDLLGVNGQEDDDDQAIRQVVLVLVGLDDLDGTAGRHALEAWVWSVVWSKEEAA